MKKMNLSENGIGDEGCEYIMKGLEVSRRRREGEIRRLTRESRRTHH